jgi:ComF family protein
MTSWLRVALDVLLPRACPPCGQPLVPGAPSPLCPACWSALTNATPSGLLAPRAARLLAALDTVRAAGPYQAGHPGNVLARAVQQLKYHGVRTLAAPLGDLLADRYPFGPEALIAPVPLHLARLRARGYNQALLLARALARRRHLRLAPRLLERTRPTAEHATLGAAARRANARGAFRVRAGQSAADETIVLVDDVVTTGATAEACARALRAGGARAVHAYAVGGTS